VGRSRASKRARTLHWRYRLGTLLLIIAGVSVPVLATVALQLMSSLPDLSDLTVRGDLLDPKIARTVDWPSLKQQQPGSRVRMLGYMMDNVRPIPDGTNVSSFVVLPEGGTLLHPAHRIPEEMIEVQLRDGSTYVYTARLLVWVEGLFTRSLVSTDERLPLYRLGDASVQIANEKDIHLFFSAPGLTASADSR
jgi:hypothetical protein